MKTQVFMKILFITASMVSVNTSHYTCQLDLIYRSVDIYWKKKIFFVTSVIFLLLSVEILSVETVLLLS